MGIEPTPRTATARSNGFEDRGSHQAPCASAWSLASAHVELLPVRRGTAGRKAALPKIQRTRIYFAGARGVRGFSAAGVGREAAKPPAIDSGGAERDRTVDLLNAIQALSQLSYGPTRERKPSKSPVGCQLGEAAPGRPGAATTSSHVAVRSARVHSHGEHSSGFFHLPGAILWSRPTVGREAPYTVRRLDLGWASCACWPEKK